MSAEPTPQGGSCPRCGAWRTPSPLACVCGYSDDDARAEAYRSLGWALLSWLLLGLTYPCAYLAGLGVILGLVLFVVALGCAMNAVRLGRAAARSGGALRAIAYVGMVLGGVVVTIPFALVVFSVVRAARG